MMEKPRKALALLLCALLFAAAPAAGEATEAEQAHVSGDYEFVLLPDGGVRITNYTGGAAELTVPNELEGRPVREIGLAAFVLGEALTKVTLPEGLTGIDDLAFNGCENLTEITLPESLESIGEFVFVSCGDLTEISLPESLESIGKNAFSFCSPALTLIVTRDSYAEQYAVDNGIAYAYAGASG